MSFCSIILHFKDLRCRYPNSWTHCLNPTAPSRTVEVSSSNFEMSQTRELRRLSSWQRWNSFPSVVCAYISAFGWPVCSPPVIQCSVLGAFQELVYIIPQHAPSTRASTARLLLPWGQRSSSRETDSASSGVDCFRMGGWSFLVMICLFISLTLQVSSGFISE